MVFISPDSLKIKATKLKVEAGEQGGGGGPERGQPEPETTGAMCIPFLMASPVIRFDISLNRVSGIYHPGDTIHGAVHLKCTADIRAYGVRIWVVGQAEVILTERPGSQPTHCDHETYIKQCVTLWGSEPPPCRHKEHQQMRTLSAGSHTYAFEYALPDSIPSSIECGDVCRGRVKYLLRAVIDSSEESARQIRDQTFIVLSNLDLNQEEKIKDAIAARKDKYVQCCCCKSGPVTCVLRLDRTGFVAGEDISLDAELQNMSRKEISSSYVSMQQVLHLKARGAMHSSTRDIFRISGGKIKPGDSAFYHDIIHIPPLPPSHMRGCTLIDVEYVIAVGVLPSGGSQTIELSVPVVIGTVPLKHLLPPDSKVLPSFCHYDHTTGEIDDYNNETLREGRPYKNIFFYYRNLYRQRDLATSTTIS